MEKKDLKSVIGDAQHWRSRAEEARAVSEHMTNAATQLMMLGVAECYERLARSAERAAYDLAVSVAGDSITVTARGTSFSVTYKRQYRTEDGLVLADSWVAPNITSPAISEFRNLAQQVAFEKAQELGWIA